MRATCIDAVQAKILTKVIYSKNSSSPASWEKHEEVSSGVYLLEVRNRLLPDSKYS